MNAPRPEQFGISAAAIPTIKAAQARQAERSNSAGCLVVLIVYGLTVAASWPTLGFLGLFVGIGPAILVAGLIVELCMERILSWFIPAEQRRQLRAYTLYLQAQKDYDNWYARTQTTFWRSLSGLEFEREVASLLRRAGIAARLTTASNDEGIDLILGDGTIVQCKQRKNPVGPAVVRELYGALVASRAPRAILISTTGFTPGVHDFVRDKPIELWDVRRLIELQRKCDAQITTP